MACPEVGNLVHFICKIFTIIFEITVKRNILNFKLKQNVEINMFWLYIFAHLEWSTDLVHESQGHPHHSSNQRDLDLLVLQRAPAAKVEL